MVKNIVKDIMFLSQKSEKATEKDKYIAQDLLDTLKANKDRCVGLAANMIGYNKAIICISGGIYDFIMINPSITNKKEEYQTEEGCLSLIGERKLKRYTKQLKEGKITLPEIQRSIAGWLGYVKHADSYNLRKSMFYIEG